MSLDPLRPLPSNLPLSSLVGRAGPDQPLGAWVRGCDHPLRLRTRRAERRVAVLAGGDLRFLLDRCGRVAVRRGERLTLLSGEISAGWRALLLAVELADDAAVERLSALFPGLESGAADLTVPLGETSPEAVLAACLQERVAVRASRVLGRI